MPHAGSLNRRFILISPLCCCDGRLHAELHGSGAGGMLERWRQVVAAAAVADVGPWRALNTVDSLQTVFHTHWSARRGCARSVRPARSQALPNPGPPLQLGRTAGTG